MQSRAEPVQSLCEFGFDTAFRDSVFQGDLPVRFCMQPLGGKNISCQFRQLIQTFVNQHFDLRNKKTRRIANLQRTDIFTQHATLQLPHFVMGAQSHLLGPQMIKAFMTHCRENVSRSIASGIETGPMFPIIDERIGYDIFGNEPVLHITGSEASETNFIPIIKRFEFFILARYRVAVSHSRQV